MSRTKILILTASVCILFVMGAILSSHIKDSDEQFTELSRARTHWATRIDDIGVERSYKEFIERYRLAPPKMEHAMIHLFGGVLYEKVGREGLGVCDHTYDFGCYHGFFGEAIAKEGTKIFSSLPEFEEVCKRKWGKTWMICQHGIGHGLLEYLGEEKLVEALQLCGTLSLTVHPVEGCAGGVFMEYRLRNLSHPSVTGFDYRPLKGDPHAPCSLVPEQFRESCYFGQPQWWELVFEGDYGKVGAQCLEIEDAHLQEVCFRGTGYFAVLNEGYDRSKAIGHCKTMPSSLTIGLCALGAAEAFFLRPEEQQYSQTTMLCDTLETEAQNLCRQRTDAMVQSFKENQ